MSRQSRAGAPAEVHADVEAVRFYRQRQGFLRFPDQLNHFQHFFVACIAKVGDVPYRRYEQMAVVIWIAIQDYDAYIRSPEHEILVVILRMLKVMANKAAGLLAGCRFVFFCCRWFLAQTLYVSNSPRRPQVLMFHNSFPVSQFIRGKT
jgi:hypothetical protein